MRQNINKESGFDEYLQNWNFKKNAFDKLVMTCYEIVNIS